MDPGSSTDTFRITSSFYIIPAPDTTYSVSAFMCLFFYFLKYICIYIFIYFYLFMIDLEKERGRDTGRGRSRLYAGSPMQDSILGLQDRALGQRQARNH